MHFTDWTISSGPKTTYLQINLFFDNFVHLYNTAWPYSSLQALLSSSYPCYPAIYLFRFLCDPLGLTRVTFMHEGRATCWSMSNSPATTLLKTMISPPPTALDCHFLSWSHKPFSMYNCRFIGSVLCRPYIDNHSYFEFMSVMATSFHLWSSTWEVVAREPWIHAHLQLHREFQAILGIHETISKEKVKWRPNLHGGLNRHEKGIGWNLLFLMRPLCTGKWRLPTWQGATVDVCSICPAH